VKRTLLLYCLLAGAAFPLAGIACGSSALTLKIAPERDAIHRHSKEVIVQIDIDGKKVTSTRRTPMNLALVLDRSGSMAGAKLEKARQAAALVVDQLTDEDSLAVITYDSDTDVLIPLRKVGSTADRERLKSRIHAIQSGGSTALHAGVTRGAEQLRRELKQEHVNRIILLSDGLANIGPQKPSDLAKLGRELRGDGMSVSTVGLGDDYNEDLMTALAESSHANYYYVQDAEKLPGIFAEELGSVRQVLAKGVIIRIEVPEGVTIREIVGQPEIKPSGRFAEIRLPEYFSADRRQFLARCEIVEPGQAELQLARVAVAYNDPISGSEVRETAMTSVRVVDDEKEAAASTRAEVVSNYAAVQNRIDKETAVSLADKGDAKAAAELLKKRIAINVQLPKEQQMKDVDTENRKLEQTVRELESNGSLGKASRKQVQYENWQGKYQKGQPADR
jgi:Ca-activated chloride channel family protein